MLSLADTYGIAKYARTYLRRYTHIYTHTHTHTRKWKKWGEKLEKEKTTKKKRVVREERMGKKEKGQTEQEGEKKDGVCAAYMLAGEQMSPDEVVG